MAATAFDAWCLFLDTVEGGLSLDPKDTGNFTPSGELKGTKFGISARSYPDLDIANLTIYEADLIRKRDFWDLIRGDELVAPAAFVLAEAAYGSGPATAIRQMQSIVGTGQDGAFGALTLAALMRSLAAAAGVENFVVEYQAQRLLYEASLGPKWDNYKGGWTRRLFHATAHALALAGVPIAPLVAAAAAPAPTPLLAAGRWLITVEPAV